MEDAPKPSPLRLRKKHGEGRRPDVTADDGARLVRAQSLRNAVTSSLITIILFSVLWITLATLSGRVFPWMTVVLGGALGMAIRHAGRGVDWRFPVLAAIMAVVGSIISNVVVAASVTAGEFGTGTLHVLRAVTTMTWPVYFDEVWNIGDTFFAALSAGLAAFLAPRKLTRQQFYALRQWREEQQDD